MAEHTWVTFILSKTDTVGASPVSDDHHSMQESPSYDEAISGESKLSFQFLFACWL